MTSEEVERLFVFIANLYQRKYYATMHLIYMNFSRHVHFGEFRDLKKLRRKQEVSLT